MGRKAPMSMTCTGPYGAMTMAGAMQRCTSGPGGLGGCRTGAKQRCGTSRFRRYSPRLRTWSTRPTPLVLLSTSGTPTITFVFLVLRRPIVVRRVRRRVRGRFAGFFGSRHGSLMVLSPALPGQHVLVLLTPPLTRYVLLQAVLPMGRRRLANTIGEIVMSTHRAAGGFHITSTAVQRGSGPHARAITSGFVSAETHIFEVL